MKKFLSDHFWTVLLPSIIASSVVTILYITLQINSGTYDKAVDIRLAFYTFSLTLVITLPMCYLGERMFRHEYQ